MHWIKFFFPTLVSSKTTDSISMGQADCISPEKSKLTHSILQNIGSHLLLILKRQRLEEKLCWCEFSQSTCYLCYGSCNGCGTGDLDWAHADSWLTVKIPNSHLQVLPRRPVAEPLPQSSASQRKYIWRSNLCMSSMNANRAICICTLWMAASIWVSEYSFSLYASWEQMAYVPETLQYWWWVNVACFLCRPGGGGSFGAAVGMFRLPLEKWPQTKSINVESGEHIKREECLEERR